MNAKNSTLNLLRICLLLLSLGILSTTILFCTGAYADVTDRLHEAKDNIGERLHEAKDRAGERLHEAKDRAGERLHQAKDSAGERLHEAKDDAADRLDDAKEGAASRFQEMKDSASQRLGDAKDAAAARLKEARDSASDRFDEAKEAVKPKSGNKVCLGKICEDSSIFYYYDCCGRFLNDCCFHLQTWSWMVVIAVSCYLLLVAFRRYTASPAIVVEKDVRMKSKAA